MSFSISGKVAIVTGAANGIGLAVARHFVDRGAQVMFADIDEARLEEELGEAASAEGGARYFAGDLCKKLTVANLLSATVDAFDRIDILVNASRRIAAADPFGGADQLEAMLEQNLMTAVRLSEAVAKRMIAQAQREGREEGPVGAIVNLSSTGGRLTGPELLAYSVSCAALEQATRALAVALAPERVRVNGVAFGSVMSASLQAALRDHPDWRQQIAARTPLGRIAPAAELVETVQFLASDASGFMTGQIVTVDGGRGLLDPVPVPAH